MTAHSKIEAAEQSPARYAHAFLSGEHDPRPTIEFQPLYSDDEWRDAAYAALDGDAADLVFMHVREEAFQAFQTWQAGDYERREFADFGDWLARNRALYGEAMTARERGGLLTDTDLLSNSKGHRVFARTMGRAG